MKRTWRRMNRGRDRRSRSRRRWVMVLYGVERDHLGIWGQTKVDVVGMVHVVGGLLCRAFLISECQGLEFGAESFDPLVNCRFD